MRGGHPAAQWLRVGQRFGAQAGGSARMGGGQRADGDRDGGDGGPGGMGKRDSETV